MKNSIRVYFRLGDTKILRILKENNLVIFIFIIEKFNAINHACSGRIFLQCRDARTQS